MGNAPGGDRPIRVAVAGASGRMGRMLIEAVEQAPDCVLSAALDISGSPALGHDATAWLGRASGVKVGADPNAAAAVSDVLIDFTRPEGSLAHLQACRAHGTRMVIGTTGFSSEQKAEVAAHAQHLGVVMSPNMAVGVNMVLQLLDMAARTLNEGYDIEIVEAHHRHKVDAPSGTALRMGEVVASALGRSLADCAVYAREGLTGERDPSTIGFATVRGGDVVGDHTVMFMGTGERIEITHKSSSRITYAQGSLRAARFLMGRGAGLFDMAQVLGFRA
jgi:4-hydroxy-tetrahydrodipicolinate reductase